MVTEADHGSPAWPPVTYEQLPWTPSDAQGSASRNELRRNRGPYSAAVTASIASATPNLDVALAAAIDDATNEVARFDQEMGVELAPFTALLLRSESAASSQIEQLTASARAIIEAELDGASSAGNAARIVANTRAMTAAVSLAHSLSTDAILTMHDELMRLQDPTSAGRWRQEQVWIGGGRLGPHHALFVPPRHERVPAAIDDLIAFMRREDIPVLAHAAIAHAQFETIHPFTDGNGRTGRALLQAMLHGKGLTRSVTVPVSAGLLTDVDTYFDALTAFREGDPTKIVRSVTDATFAAITNARELVTDLRAIRASWDVRITARRNSAAWRLADLLPGQPVITASVAAKALGIAMSNVYPAISALQDAGIVLESTHGRRGRIWRSVEVLDALDAFAARAGRRGRASRR